MEVAHIVFIENIKLSLPLPLFYLTDNWQKFCLANGGVVKFLITVSYQLDEGVAPLLLQLLQAAICSGGSGKGQSVF